LRARSTLGKYKIIKRIAEGGFAAVYSARDTVSGVAVALKIPHPHLVTKAMLAAFRAEVRITEQLDHPNILPVKDAGTIDNVFYVASPLGLETLGDRLARRLSARTMVDFASQMLEALACAHRKRIMHCDIKPDNFIVFPENRLRLADFGIAKVALRTLAASGSGTVGYIAPEQAMGKPSLRSDVFSLGLVLYRMFSGCLPEWPYHEPLAGTERIKKSLHPDLVRLLHRSLQVDSTLRFADGVAMHRAFERVKRRAVRRTVSRKSKKNQTNVTWKTVRWREFSRRFRAPLDTCETCGRCGGPMSAAMQGCPWCGVKRRVRKVPTRFPQHCPRCKRGVKSDWRFCPWCYGASINPDSRRRYSDERYVARCSNEACNDKSLMPFMRYCPWCRRKVTRAWRFEGASHQCARCAWGVLPDFWDYCPWCSKRTSPRG
jgi:serine/threonine-protein kinase